MRKKILILTFFLLLFFTGLYAQTASQTNFNTFHDGVLPWNDFQDHFSNTVKAGNIERDIIWDNWYDPFGADGYNVRPHMVLCQDGGYAVTGYYIIEDGMGGYLEWCGYVLKTDSEGNFLWADKDTLSFPTAPTHESDCIIETSDGGLINAGDGFMIKRDSDGNRLWTQDLDIAPHTMCYSHDGNIILSGGTSDEYTLFRKIDNNGNELLNNDFNVGASTSIKRIIPTSDGGYAMTGSITQEVGYHGDIIIIKTDAVGDTLWTYRKDGCGYSDVGNWIIENSENNLLIVGGILPTPVTIRGYLALLDLECNIIREDIVGNNDIWYEHFYAIDLPDDSSFLLSTAYRVYKSDYNFNIEWISEEPLGWYQKLSEGYLFYIGGINGVNLRRTDENIVSVSNNVISLNQPNLKCYPNPFNPTTTISYSIPAAAAVELSIYNVKGQKVVTLVNQHQEAGEYNAQWNGTDEQNNSVASGVYFYKLSDDSGRSSVQKCLLLK